MNGLGMWLQPVSRWLISWLVSRWGIGLLLLGTVALAGSTAVYLTRGYDHPARIGVIVPNATTSVTAQGSRCWRAFLPSQPVTCGLQGR